MDSDTGAMAVIGSGSDQEKMNSINDSSSSTPGPKASKTYKRRKFACVECRQQKSKCDAHEKAPEPCTKCAKKGVQCVLQKDFRRTYKRARNEAIEQRFKELTKTLTNLSSEEILKKIQEEQSALLDKRNFTKEKVKQLKEQNIFKSEDESTNELEKLIRMESNTNTCKMGRDSVTPPPIQFDFASGMTSEQLKCTPKSLGDIYMSSFDIAELFQEFATKYHRFLPVVDLSNGAERIYALSPCLFWVILLIGLRRSKLNSGDIMRRLTVLVKSTLAEITISPIIRYTPSDTDEPILNVASVYSVQAFLLYTFWPPLTSSLSADTSWNTIGTAMFQAIRVGLNCADFSKEYATANSELINEQRRTWLCCNIVSQIIASSFGFPAYVSFDHAVMSSIKGYSHSKDSSDQIPNPLGQMTQIAHFENQIINTMNSNPTNKLGMVNQDEKQPLLQVLNQQLSQLEINLQENDLDEIRRFLLLVAKVHLLTYYFTDLTSETKSSSTSTFMKMETNFETKRGLVKVYNAAINLLNHSDNMCKHDSTVIKYFPGCFVLNIWQSACIISKLVHSSLSSVLDIEAGKKAYQRAALLTYNASVLKHDMAYRSSGIMRSIWSLFANMYEAWKLENEGNLSPKQDFNLNITVKSRMSVSVFFDCLYILKEKCGMAKLKRENDLLGRRGSENDAKRQNIDEDGEDDDDDDDEGDGYNERDVKHPVRKARRIIETIPLDPNPINAGIINDGGSLSAQSQHVSPLAYDSLMYRNNKDIIHSTVTSPGDDKKGHIVDEALKRKSTNSDPGYNASITAPSVNFSEGQKFVINYIPPLHSNKYDDPSGSVVGVATPISQGSQLKHNGVNKPGENNDETATVTSKDSPNSFMANWDNWESDMVWKDVDILMNEFAFNPTL